MCCSVNITLIIIIYFVHFNGYTQAKLKQLNVVFRHGDRAPMTLEVEAFPNLFANESFSPVSLGGLTNSGKLRMFRLGQYLRRQYDDFLGDIYLTENVIARSTDFVRAKMSLQLVLAGLYPPKGVQRWNDEMDWQPVSFDSVPKLDDALMLPVECPKYLEERERVEKSPKVRKKLDTFRSLMKFLTAKTGKRIKSTLDMFTLYNTLMATTSTNLELPSWTKGIFPHGQLYDAAAHEYDLFSYNNKLKKLNGGMLLRKILENMYERATNSSSSESKIYLYSGHDINVASLLQVLDVYQNDIPRYSSAVIIELHKESCRYFVKIKYYRGSHLHRNNQSVSKELYNPRCPKHCSLDKLKRILENVIPSDEDVKCEKRSLRITDLDRSTKVTGIRKGVLYEIRKEDKFRYLLY